MKQIVSIDFDIIMAPSISLYNDKVPALSWDTLLEDPYMKLLIIDPEHYSKIFKYIIRCCQSLSKEQIHFIEDHGQAVRYITEPCDLINIDHHHDLGYDDLNPQKDDTQSPTCANWVKYLQQQSLINNYMWINNANSLSKDTMPFWTTIKDFRNVSVEDLPIPNELIICLSEPWVPYAYRSLFYTLMDYCNDKYNTHFEILTGPYIQST